MSGRTTQGAACLQCDKDPLSYSIKHKLCYIGHHRFLPLVHRCRRKKDLLCIHKDKQHQPESFSPAELEAEMEKVRHLKPGVGIDFVSKKRKRTDPTPIWKRRYGLWDLPYWPKLKLRHNLDVMHIDKNILDSILGTLLELEGKNKDTYNASLDLKTLKIRTTLHMKEVDKNKFTFPLAPYCLTKVRKTCLCQYLYDCTYSDGFSSNMSKCVNVQTRKVLGLKTHDCHILLQRTLPAGVRGLVDPHIYQAIADLGKNFKDLCSKTLERDVLL